MREVQVRKCVGFSLLHPRKPHPALAWTWRLSGSSEIWSQLGLHLPHYILGWCGNDCKSWFPPDCFWSGIKGSWEKTEAEVISSFRGPLGWNWAGLLGSRLASTDRIIPSLGLVRRITSKASEGFRKPRCVWVPTLECFPLTAIHRPVVWFESLLDLHSNLLSF